MQVYYLCSLLVVTLRLKKVNNTVKIIGKNIMPIIPANLNPIKIKIRVNRGFISICFPMILGSIEFLVMVIIKYKIKSPTAKK